MIIYSATNTLNGKVYIGSTMQALSDRRAKHNFKAITDRVDRPFYRDIRYLGAETFEWKPLIEADSEAAMRSMESELIELVREVVPGSLYNVARDGGCNRGGSATEKTRAKLSAAKHKWHAGGVRFKKRGYSFRHVFAGTTHRDEVLALRKSGATYDDIGARYGVAPATVCAAVRRWWRG